MKLIILFLFAISAAFAGCNGTAKENSQASAVSSADTASLPLAKVEFKVNGMHCAGCENTIKMNLKEIKGVALVEASFKNNQAVVSFDSTKTNETEIASAIESAGYKVDTFMRK
jgi:copper chaperone CopZ